MPCERIETPTGVVIACSRGRRPIKCCVCGRQADRLCDGPLLDEHGAARGTCDKGICLNCSTQTRRNGKVLDYCPEHKALAAGRPQV